MLAEQQYHRNNLCEFHEPHKQQSGLSISHPKSQKQQVFSKVFTEGELESCLATQLSKQDIFAWSSLSSLSSTLSTGSLFSLSDSFTMPTRYISTGTLFNNLDLLPVDADVDPISYVCFNCWQIGHKHRDCSEVKLLYCCNCGRRGVHVEECPRCARSYHDFLCKLNKQYQTFFGCMETSKPKELTKSVQDIKLNAAVEGKSVECWDDFVEDDCKYSQTSFSDPMQKKSSMSECNHWDDYQSPRLNLVEKSSKVHSLNATKEEVAKLKEDSWDDFENNSYSYQCGNCDPAVTNYDSFIIPGEEAKSLNEYQSDVDQGSSKDIYCGFDKKNYCKGFYTSENQRAEHESECWSNHGKGEFQSSWEESAANTTDAYLIESSAQNIEAAIPTSSIQSSPEDQDNIEKDLRVEDVFRSPEIIKPKENNLIVFTSEKEKDHDHLEVFASLQSSFCEEKKIDNFMMSLDSTTDEDYWTDFDDDYSSLPGSFANEYESLNTTPDDENDFTNTLATDTTHIEENSEFYKPFYVSQNNNLNWKLSYFKTEEINNQYAVQQTCEKKIYQLNSLKNSINGESDIQGEFDEYENMIVDEDKRSEPFLYAGQAIQEFLQLLESLKHLPIQTQNLAVLHFISKHRDQLW